MINKHLLAQILAERSRHGQTGQMPGHFAAGGPTFANGPMVSPGPVNANTQPPPVLPMANSNPIGFTPTAPHSLNFVPKFHSGKGIGVPKAPAVAKLPRLGQFMKMKS